MSIFRKLFSRKPVEVPPDQQELVDWLTELGKQQASRPRRKGPRAKHPVLIALPLSGQIGVREEWDKCLALQNQLRDELPESLGEVDGNEIGGGTYSIWLMGVTESGVTGWLKDYFAKNPPPEGTKISVMRR